MKKIIPLILCILLLAIAVGEFLIFYKLWHKEKPKAQAVMETYCAENDYDLLCVVDNKGETDTGLEYSYLAYARDNAEINIFYLTADYQIIGVEIKR